jgi:hypothetical protein
LRRFASWSACSERILGPVTSSRGEVGVVTGCPFRLLQPFVLGAGGHLAGRRGDLGRLGQHAEVGGVQAPWSASVVMRA